MSTPASTPATAPTRFGRYTIERLLGRGGMGAVYLARQVDLDRPVALKVIHPELAKDPAVVARLQREARFAARINAENVVRVFDSGVESGVPFIAMEYVNGISAAALMKRRGGKLAPREATRLVLAAARGLEVAHKAGLIHRDVKPANVLITTEGRVKLADFGIARVHEKQSPEGTLSLPGQIVGTPDYMAPEQANEQELDARADIYSLGVTYYELLTGSLPFHRSTVFGTLAQVLTGRVAPPRELVPEIPEAVEQACLALMARKRDERPQTAAAVVELLQGLLSGALSGGSERLTVPIPPPSGEVPSAARVSKVTQDQGRGPVVLVAGICALAVVVGFAAAYTVHESRKSEREAQDRLADAEAKRLSAEDSARRAKLALEAEARDKAAKEAEEAERAALLKEAAEKDEAQRRARESAPPAPPSPPPPPPQVALPPPPPVPARDPEKEAKERAEREAEKQRRRDSEAFGAALTEELPHLRGCLTERRGADAHELLERLRRMKHGDAEEQVLRWIEGIVHAIDDWNEQVKGDAPPDVALKQLAVASWKKKPADASRRAATLVAAAQGLVVPSVLYSEDASIPTDCERLALEKPARGPKIEAIGDLDKLALLSAEREQWLHAVDKVVGVNGHDGHVARAELEVIEKVKAGAAEVKELIGTHDEEKVQARVEKLVTAIKKMVGSRLPGGFLAAQENKKPLDLLARIPVLMKLVRKASCDGWTRHPPKGFDPVRFDEQYSELPLWMIELGCLEDAPKNPEVRAGIVILAAQARDTLVEGLFMDPASMKGDLKGILELLGLEAPKLADKQLQQPQQGPQKGPPGPPPPPR